MVILIPSGSEFVLLFLLFKDEADVFTSSDGPQPHFITIEFPRKVAIQVRTSDCTAVAAAHPSLETKPLPKLSTG